MASKLAARIIAYGATVRSGPDAPDLRATIPVREADGTLTAVVSVSDGTHYGEAPFAVGDLAAFTSDLRGTFERKEPGCWPLPLLDGEVARLPRDVVADLAETIRGASEAGYYDDGVKQRLDDLAQRLEDLVAGKTLALVVTDEATDSTGGVHERIRKAAGLQ